MNPQLFKYGCCDLYLQFKGTDLHIFGFSQAGAKIFIKFGLHMHLGKVFSN